MCMQHGPALHCPVKVRSISTRFIIGGTAPWNSKTELQSNYKLADKLQSQAESMLASLRANRPLMHILSTQLQLQVEHEHLLTRNT
jgi:hypothetical protein